MEPRSSALADTLAEGDSLLRALDENEALNVPHLRELRDQLAAVIGAIKELADEKHGTSFFGVDGGRGPGQPVAAAAAAGGVHDARTLEIVEDLRQVVRRHAGEDRQLAAQQRLPLGSPRQAAQSAKGVFGRGREHLWTSGSPDEQLNKSSGWDRTRQKEGLI
jgi:hypothetical protein